MSLFPVSGHVLVRKPGEIEPGERLAAPPQIDGAGELDRTPSQFFFELPDQTFIGSFACLAGSAETRDAPGSPFRTGRSTFEDQPTVERLQNQATVGWPVRIRNCWIGIH